MSSSPINNNPLLASLQGSSAASSKTSGSAAPFGPLANVDTFYKLLVTQLTNQDPLNPMSNQDLSAQLAQFSTASGVQSVQASLASLAAQISQTQGLQAANLVGRTVVFDSNSLSLPASGSPAAGFTHDAAASRVDVSVVGGNGQTLRRLSLGPMAAGVQNFTWDGLDSSGARVPAGSYSFKVEAADATGAAVTASPFGAGRVQSVLLQGKDGPGVQIEGQSQPIALNRLQGVV